MVDAGFKFVKILQLLCDTRISFCGTEFTTVLMFINELWNSRSFVALMVGVYESSFKQMKLTRLMNSRTWKLDDITHMIKFLSNFSVWNKVWVVLFDSYLMTSIQRKCLKTWNFTNKFVLNLICTFLIIYLNFTLSISDERFNWKMLT